MPARALRKLDLGVDPEHLAAVSVSAPKAAYAKLERAACLYRNVLQRSQQIPGVMAAAAVTLLPVSFNGYSDWIRFAGQP